MDDRDRRPGGVRRRETLARGVHRVLPVRREHVTRRATWTCTSSRGDTTACCATSGPVTGVLSIDFPARFQSWDVDPAALFDAPVVKKEASRGSGGGHLGRGPAPRSSSCGWTATAKARTYASGDGRVRAVMRPQTALRPPVRRVQRGHQALRRVRDAKLGRTGVQSSARRGRQALDLKIGVAFTRFQTNHFRDKFSGLDASVVSYGPCQTPTLSFVAARRKQIAAHDPEPFWRVVLTCPDLFESTSRKASSASPLENDESERPRRVRERKDANAREDSVTNAPEPNASVVWRRGRVFDKKIGEAYARLVGGSLSARDGACVARVASSTETETLKPPPCGLNTVDLLKSCSAGMGWARTA